MAEAAPTYPDPLRRFLITVPSMLASTMVAVDITIANVALPHMASSLSASQDQIIWVLTSYLIAGAIATPLSGWLASRYGRKAVMVWSVAGFTIASALCGAATDLTTVVLARMLQGACGAALIPLSQAILLDINPPENHGRAMAIFSLGSMAGPIIGPTLGGWLTDSLSWRWVFYINVPFGILATIGMLTFLTGTRNGEMPARFDFFGFLAVSTVLASFQLILDRGEQLDWFEATEIKIYAVVCGLSLFMTLVHMMTARETFIRPELFRDRNFVIGSLFGVMLGVVVFATVPIIVVMTQSLLGYSAFRTGMVGMPRAIGTLFAIMVVGRLVGKIDTRIILAFGMALTAASMWMYSRIDLYVDQETLLWAGLVQGFAGGLIFVPLTVIVFATLPAGLRNEGAAMNALTRNIGNAVGISLLQRQLIDDTAMSRAQLTEAVRPDNPAMQYARPDFDPSSTEALARLNAEVMRQATMLGNVQVYELICVMALFMIPLIFMMRSSRNTDAGKQLPMVE